MTTAATETKRLIDQDENKYVSIKRVIIVGDISPATIAIGKALKELGETVYDLDGTCDVHEVKRMIRGKEEVVQTFDNPHRDWPLWIEAAQAKIDGNPYGKAEFDKLTGRYTVLAAGPASVFTNDLIKAYPYAKVIVVNTKPVSLSEEQAEDLCKLARHDATGVFRNISTFTKIASKVLEPVSLDNVPKDMILKIDNLDSWAPLCTFLGNGKYPPKTPVPRAIRLSDKLSARASKVYSEYITTVVVHGLYVITAICAGIAMHFLAKGVISFKEALMADCFTSCCFLASVYTYKSPKEIAAESKITPTETAAVTTKTTVAPAKAPVAPTKAPVVPAKAAAAPLKATATEFKPPATKHRTKNNNKSTGGNKKPPINNNKSGHKRTWSAPVERPPRPAQPVVSTWQNFHYEIARDDYCKYVANEAAKAAAGYNPNVAEHEHKHVARKHE
ncbi:hypothetical protein BDV96DRAFT_640612 [Lophiotrema nucula]|uniref:Uncharacterized protein n=1 Tax=Lophiotrema nucula TaxID=690887 RepID=A0A6A5ZQS3_9PLEO|nr:hypothetical protein BDV96DRAFT_640612 [Lophiotrema nucula]